MISSSFGVLFDGDVYLDRQCFPFSRTVLFSYFIRLFVVFFYQFICSFVCFNVFCASVTSSTPTPSIIGVLLPLLAAFGGASAEIIVLVESALSPWTKMFHFLRVCNIGLRRQLSSSVDIRSSVCAHTVS